MVQLIGNVRTAAGLTVKAKLDTRTYPLGVKVPKVDMEALHLTQDSFHGEWNYTIHPRRGLTNSVTKLFRIKSRSHRFDSTRPSRELFLGRLERLT